jgi:hypothetical protein
MLHSLYAPFCLYLYHFRILYNSFLSCSVPWCVEIVISVVLCYLLCVGCIDDGVGRRGRRHEWWLGSGYFTILTICGVFLVCCVESNTLQHSFFYSVVFLVYFWFFTVCCFWCVVVFYCVVALVYCCDFVLLCYNVLYCYWWCDVLCGVTCVFGVFLFYIVLWFRYIIVILLCCVIIWCVVMCCVVRYSVFCCVPARRGRRRVRGSRGPRGSAAPTRRGGRAAHAPSSSHSSAGTRALGSPGTAAFVCNTIHKFMFNKKII